MITIFCTVVLSVIQGVALNTVVLPLSKGRMLQYYVDDLLKACEANKQKLQSIKQILEE
jgi:hypothetical protein